jgi:hypothetical protein
MTPAVLKYMAMRDATPPEVFERARALLRIAGADGLAISCGKCKGAFAASVWTEREIGGRLPVGEFQCPACGWAFRRVSVRGEIQLKTIGGRL